MAETLILATIRHAGNVVHNGLFRTWAAAKARADSSLGADHALVGVADAVTCQPLRQGRGFVWRRMTIGGSRDATFEWLAVERAAGREPPPNFSLLTTTTRQRGVSRLFTDLDVAMARALAHMRGETFATTSIRGDPALGIGMHGKRRHAFVQNLALPDDGPKSNG